MTGSTTCPSLRLHQPVRTKHERTTSNVRFSSSLANGNGSRASLVPYNTSRRWEPGPTHTHTHTHTKTTMWTSKLGNKYPIDEIERNHTATIAKLTKLRHEGANKFCAECGNPGTVWSSVNLGVFTCMRCGSLHRALGTHVSKPKGCHGSYLWVRFIDVHC